MGNYTTEGLSVSIPTWETLESFARGAVQQLLQRILEEEVTQLLGRARWERSASGGGVDPQQGHRNGYGKSRRLSMSTGTITLRRPRVRGLEGRFESRMLPLFRRRTQEIGELLPQLYYTAWRKAISTWCYGGRQERRHPCRPAPSPG